MKSFLPVVAIVLLVVLAGCRSEGSSPADTEVRAGFEEAPTFSLLQLGDAMPVFEGVGLDGDPIRVGSGTGLTLVNLWATWCGPCVEEFPDLETLHREFKDSGLRVLGINVDEMDADRITAFVNELGATFPIALDPGADYQDTVGAVAMPTSFLVTDNGELIRKWSGRLTHANLDEIRGLVEDDAG